MCDNIHPMDYYYFKIISKENYSAGKVSLKYKYITAI